MGFFEFFGFDIKGFFIGMLPLVLLIASGVLGVLSLFGLVSVKICLIVLGIFILSFIFIYCACYHEISEAFEEDENKQKKWKRILLFFNVFVFPFWFAFFWSEV